MLMEEVLPLGLAAGEEREGQGAGREHPEGGEDEMRKDEL